MTVPGGLNGIGPIKQRGITFHCIQQQSLVGGCRLDFEGIGITEVHLYLPQMHFRARNFRSKSQRNAFHRLDTDGDQVRLHLVFGRQVEKHVRNALELNDDLVILCGSRFPERR